MSLTVSKNFAHRQWTSAATGGTFNGMGLTVKKRRKRQKWTQEQLAEAAGLSAPYISQIETGEKQPSLDALTSLAQALKCEVFELFDEQPLTPEIRALATEISALDESDRHLVEQMVRKLAARHA